MFQRKHAGKNIMEIVRANKNNLASIIMGKNISFPWRGQKDVVISVPYKEWLCFVKEHQHLMTNRIPLNYSKMLASDDEEIKVRYFFYEMSWALYSELANSSNTGKDATLILPYFDDGESVDIMDVVKEVLRMDTPVYDKCHNNLRTSTRNYFSLLGDTDLSYGLVKLNNLSEWNNLIFKICIYLQSKSSNRIITKKLNIDWRA